MPKRIFNVAFYRTFLGFLCLLTQATQAQIYKAGQKKIIEIGYDIQNYDYVADNIRNMETSPYDGVVFELKIPKSNGLYRRQYSMCNPDLILETDFNFSKLNQIRSTKLTDNFIRVLVQDDFDQNRFSWLNDAVWTNIKASTKVLSKAVKAAQAKGIFLDTEHYISPNPWEYNASLYPNHTSQQLYDKVRQRGKEFMSELQSEVPNIKVMYAWGYDFVEKWGQSDYYDQEYALLKPFLDGMLEAAGPQVMLIDGNQATYFTVINEDYTWWYDQVKAKYLNDRIPSELVTKYKTQYQVAFAPIVNRYFNIPYRQPGYDFDFNGIDTQFRKDWVEHAVYNHLLTTDEYVWTWSQGDVDWWTVPTFQNKTEWVNAINNAKTKLATGQPIGTTMIRNGKSGVKELGAEFDVKSFSAVLSGPAHNGSVPVGDVEFTLTPSDLANLSYYYLYINSVNDGYAVATTQTKNLQEGKYTAWVFGYTKANKTFQSNPITFRVGTADTEAPSVPSGLAVSNVLSTSFTVFWAASTDNIGVSSYDVFRDGVLVDNIQSTSFNFTGLQPNISYNIFIKAKDIAGNVSATSQTLVVKTSQAPCSSPSCSSITIKTN